MKADSFIDRVLPQFFPASWLEQSALVFSDFPSLIRVGYVIRDSGNLSYLCKENLEGLSLSMDVLHSAALENLARLPSASISIGKVPGGAEGWIHATEDNFAAVRVLLPKVQEAFRQEIGDSFLFTIPHRDDCFCWSVGQAADRQVQHAKDALVAFQEEEYNLTPDIFLFSHGRFRLHQAQVSADDEGYNGKPG